MYKKKGLNAHVLQWPSMKNITTVYLWTLENNCQFVAASTNMIKVYTAQSANHTVYQKHPETLATSQPLRFSEMD